MRIGIDLMGSDAAPEQLYEAILPSNSSLSNHLAFQLFASEEVVSDLKRNKTIPKNIQLISCKEYISMEENPLSAVRRKKKSTLFEALKSLIRGDISAFITTGNTGALISAASILVPKYSGIRKPALLALLPTVKHDVTILDVGGNVHCKPEDLLQFTKLGVAFKKFQGVGKPMVGLLNIGIESRKGTEAVQKAYKLLTNIPSSYYTFKGNIEAREVFLGDLDIVVSDGFTGNILLKTAEGVAEMILRSLASSTKLETSHHFLQEKYQYAQYPGAMLVGLDKLVIKCHGNPDGAVNMLSNTIKHTVQLIQADVIGKMKSYYEEMESA